MFNSALITVKNLEVKTWMPSKCPQERNGQRRGRQIHNEILLGSIKKKKNEIMSFAAQMDGPGDYHTE